MDVEYSVEVYRQLEKEFQSTGLHRPMSCERYEAGTVLTYDITGVAQPNTVRVRLIIEKFVGGGFAGQVYRVKLLEFESGNSVIESLEVGKKYAIKILIPPSNFSRLFRNVLYWLGFQGPFQLQVNPFAARAGALWQKFIRRGAKIKFGKESSVVDIYATFVDQNLGSCGECRCAVGRRRRRDDLVAAAGTGRRLAVAPGSAVHEPRRGQEGSFPRRRLDRRLHRFVLEALRLDHGAAGHRDQVSRDQACASGTRQTLGRSVCAGI